MKVVIYQQAQKLFSTHVRYVSLPNFSSEVSIWLLSWLSLHLSSPLRWSEVIFHRWISYLTCGNCEFPTVLITFYQFYRNLFTSISAITHVNELKHGHCSFNFTISTVCLTCWPQLLHWQATFTVCYMNSSCTPGVICMKSLHDTGRLKLSSGTLQVKLAKMWLKL